MQYLIDFIDSTTEQQVSEYFASFTSTILANYDRFGKVYHIETEVEPPQSPFIEYCTRDDAQALQLLDFTVNANTSFGKIVTDGSIPTITVTNEDKNWWKFFSLFNPDLENSEYITNRRGKDINIYILDSGIELTHPEFSEADVTNLFTFNNNFSDTKGHGTAIASVIVGKTCGLTNATIKSVKIFDSLTATKQSDMLRALDAIFLDYANSAADHAIVNCSWAISKNTYIEDKIRVMCQSGIFFVAAAGNNGVAIENITPASMSEVVTIGAYNNQLKPCDFSNYTGASGISLTQSQVNYGALDGWAPGQDIWAAGLNGSYYNVAGTSIAAAIHSGAIAYGLTIGYDNHIILNPIDYYSAFSFGKNDFLDLSDPKYSNSVNRISLYKDTWPTWGKNQSALVYRYSAFENEEFHLSVFNSTLVKKYEILTDLPFNWKVSSCGKMFGLTPQLDSGQRFSLIVLPIRATFYDDTTENFELQFAIKAANYDPTTETSGDTDLDLVLNSFACSNGGTFCRTLSQCFDNCINNVCTFNFNYCDKPELSCWCGPTPP